MSVLGLSIQYYVGSAQSSEPVFRTLQFAFERAGAEMAQVGRYMFPRVITVLEEASAKQLAAGGAGPVAGRWAPLSPAYAAWKARRYPGKPVMERSGNLRHALTNASSTFADRSFTDVLLTFGTSGLNYASYHQAGTRRLPARPLFDFGDEANQALQVAARAGVMEVVKKAKLDALLNVEGAS